MIDWDVCLDQHLQTIYKPSTNYLCTIYTPSPLGMDVLLMNALPEDRMLVSKAMMYSRPILRPRCPQCPQMSLMNSLMN